MWSSSGGAFRANSMGFHHLNLFPSQCKEPFGKCTVEEGKGNSGKLMIRILSRLLRSSWIAKVSSNDLHLCWKASSTFSIQVASKRKFFVAHFSFFYSFGVIRNLRLYFSQASFKLKKLNFNKLSLVLQSRMNHAD